MDIKTTAKDFVNSKDYLSKLSEDERNLLIIELSLLLVDFEIEIDKKQLEKYDELINNFKIQNNVKIKSTFTKSMSEIY